MRRFLTLVSFILLAFVTIGLKIALHDPPGQTPAAMQGRVASLLARSGWLPAGVADLTADGDIQVESFRHPSCRKELRVMSLPPRPDVLGLADTLSGDGTRLMFIYRGTVSGDPPTDDALLYGRALRYLTLLRGQPENGSAIVVAAMPAGCRPAALVPWAELR